SSTASAKASIESAGARLRAMSAALLRCTPEARAYAACVVQRQEESASAAGGRPGVCSAEFALLKSCMADKAKK
ncbi:hypothetical protein BOX15_Mlig028178g1, partial [Macrostomum lignano]